VGGGDELDVGSMTNRRYYPTAKEREDANTGSTETPEE
jgi:hypothetical protein